MAEDPKGSDDSQLRVEHVLAALNQIGTLTAQVHRALNGLDPKMVLGIRGPDPVPGSANVGQCVMVPPKERV
jgi:hypothetical protein